jgi:general secretion pathway protein N
MNAAHQRQLTPALVGLVAVLVLVFVLMLAGVGRHVHWKAPRNHPPLPPAANPADMPQPIPLQQFALVWEKPLFNPGRKPIAHAVEGGSSLGDLNLTGIILTQRLHMALLHDKNGDRELRLREGESLPDGSITLVEVHPRSALFDSPSGRTELKLPAGAPIDEPKADAASASAADQSDGTPLMRAQPGDNANPRVAPAGERQPPHIRPQQQDNSRESFLERLRENVRKRRAAHAGSTPAGVR